MFLSIIITLFLGSVIGIVTSLSVYGFISLVKFLTNVFRNPELNFTGFDSLFTNTGSFLLFIVLIPCSVGLLVGFLRKYALGSSGMVHQM